MKRVLLASKNGLWGGVPFLIDSPVAHNRLQKGGGVMPSWCPWHPPRRPHPHPNCPYHLPRVRGGLGVEAEVGGWERDSGTPTTRPPTEQSTTDNE